MPSISRSALVPFSASQMYDLVNDIDSYSNFLPWCGHSATHESTPDYKIAEVRIQKGPLVKSFTTKNWLVAGQQIKLELVDGPFKNLDGEWRFTAIGDSGCRVNFNIEFTFAGGLLERAISPLFNEICSRLVDAFVERAQQIYA